MLAARRLAVLLGLTAILALPSSGGAAAPSSGAAELRQRDTSLAARERAATQELYSLEAQLAVARSRLAELTDQREAAEARLTRLRIELDVAWQSAYIAEEHLGARIRQLYQQGQLDPVAILLGAESLDEAIGGLDGLRSIASGDRDLLEQGPAGAGRADLGEAARGGPRRERCARPSRPRRRRPRPSRRRVPSEAPTSPSWRGSAGSTHDGSSACAARLAPPASARRSSRLRRRRRWRRPRRRRAGARTAYTGGEQTMTVSSTGYAIRGRTASGLPTGWGIVAVDPSVIPLGTRMTIPGYGEGVAADTGGAVRGATIDLWFPTLAQALAWGRKTVTITLHG